MVSSLFLGLISEFPMVDSDMITLAVIQLAGAFVLSGILIFTLLKFLPRTAMWNKLILKKNIDKKSGYTAEENVKDLVGKNGKAHTDLRPSGTAKIEGQRVDVVTTGEFIKRGSKIKVVAEEGSKVVVEKI